MYIYPFPSGRSFPFIIGVDEIYWHEFKFPGFNGTVIVVSVTHMYAVGWLWLRGVENDCESSSFLTEDEILLDSIQ